MTRTELLKSVASKLSSKQAANDARLIVMIACKISHEELLANGRKTASLFERFKAQRLVSRRNNNEPLAYISGTRSFFGRDFFVNNKVLIPRPETELLVEEAIKLSTTHDVIIEVGTGSGAIAISLAAELNKDVIATDISSSALNVARKNAKRHHVDSLISFFQGDLLDPIITEFSNTKSYLIVANLPYLSQNMLSTSPSEVRDHEPTLALKSDSNDGLDLYRKLFHQLSTVDCKLLTCVIEFDPRQEKAIKKLSDKWNDSTSTIIKDLAGHPRALKIETR